MEIAAKIAGEGGGRVLETLQGEIEASTGSTPGVAAVHSAE